MKIDFSPRLFMEGFGNINYQVPASGGGAAVANDGLSVNGGDVQLGQPVGAVGNPAALTEDRDIPFNGNLLNFIGSGTNRITFDADGVISIFNDTFPPEFYSIIDGTAAFRVFSLGPGQFGIDFGDGQATYLTMDPVTRRLIYVAGTIETQGGFASNIKTIATGIYNMLSTDGTLICDTSGGAIVIDIDPVLCARKINWIKKAGTDVNQIQIIPTSGQIFGGAGGAASFTFSDAGESIQIQSDGVNIYVL